MKLKRRVLLHNNNLDQIAREVVITTLEPGTTRMNVTAADTGAWGQRITGRHWGVLEARVSYAIDVHTNNMQRRREVFDAVNAWAIKKGWLEFVSEAPGRRIYVDEVELPSPGDLWDWTANYTIIFRAYNVPFWQDTDAQTITKKKFANGKEDSLTMEIGGTAPSVIDLSFKNVSGKTITNFQVKVGTQTLKLTNVQLEKDETLNMTHTAAGILKITADATRSGKAVSRSVYGLLTGDDDMIVEPGKVLIKVSATRAGDLTVSNKARWL